MKFSVLALDYDGTIARHGRAQPKVLAAIRETRARGIAVVLVTGRILADLRRVLPEDDIFDAIVAENGAVLAFPNGRTRALGRPGSRDLLSDLCLRRIDCAIGECVIEADASAAPIILDAIRKLELPLTLVFNRSRVMVLPQGISKASGLREALNTMRLSLHNCIGIGDAENDGPLLEACEIGVAVSWGSKSLQALSDRVLHGDGPDALAGYILEVSSHTKLPPHRADNRRILLGETATGPLDTAIHGRNILIAGDPRSGKSWITGLFCEQLLLQGYCLCVIDPEGDYATLETLPGVVVFRGDEPPPRLSDVSRALRHHDTSIVIDLSGLTHDEKLGYVSQLLPTLASLRRSTGLPHWIVVDEAHYFLSHDESMQPVDFELAAYVLITYRPSLLHPELLAAVETILVTPLTDPVEVSALTSLCGAEDAASAWSATLANLGIDEAARAPRPAAPGALPQRFTIAPRLTSHVRHRAKYLEVPMPQEHAFYFTCNGQNMGAPARTLKEFVQMQQRLPIEALAGHAERGDFSRWIGRVFGDQPLADAIGKVEDGFRNGRVKRLPDALVKPIRERYEVPFGVHA
jgi:hydroxymethylpyrimidine pyrophosphatase-like HAD family hydrolase